jgi:hypothetical protein
MKRIKHRNLLPYFIDDERSLAKRRAYVASCEKFFKELSGKQGKRNKLQASSSKLQAPSVKRQALIRTQLNSTNK